MDDDLDRLEAGLCMAKAKINMDLARIKMARACRLATASFERFGMSWQLVEMRSADEGEFDNRLHDWLGSE